LLPNTSWRCENLGEKETVRWKGEKKGSRVTKQGTTREGPKKGYQKGGGLGVPRCPGKKRGGKGKSEKL